jgi:hypothetical protein
MSVAIVNAIAGGAIPQRTSWANLYYESPAFGLAPPVENSESAGKRAVANRPQDAILPYR